MRTVDSSKRCFIYNFWFQHVWGGSTAVPECWTCWHRHGWTQSVAHVPCHHTGRVNSGSARCLSTADIEWPLPTWEHHSARQQNPRLKEETRGKRIQHQIPQICSANGPLRLWSRENIWACVSFVLVFIYSCCAHNEKWWMNAHI